MNEKLGAAAGYEDSRVYGDPQAAELCPADDMFEGQAGRPPIYHGGERRRRLRCREEHPGFLFSKYTPRGPKLRNGHGIHGTVGEESTVHPWTRVWQQSCFVYIL